jgi:hypothetical protein
LFISARQIETLINRPDTETLKGKRHRAMQAHQQGHVRKQRGLCSGCAWRHPAARRR